MNPQINLLVLRARDVEATANFYRPLGFEFQAEQHERGPLHLACERDGFVLEIYPLKPKQGEVTDSITLGLRVESLEAALASLGVSAEIREGEARFCTLRDPDGRTVRLEEL